MASYLSLWLTGLLLGAICRAQFPPPLNVSGLTVMKSPINSNITLSFKSPLPGTCTTVFATQKQFSGYINLPPGVLNPTQGNYSINTFFWFIEARQVPESAPLTVFINGGPGSSSMVGLFQEVGACEVVEVARGRLGTIAREWGWDRSSNILFVDQPVQTGFSFDTPTNASLNLLNELFTVPPTDTPRTQPSYTFLNGTLSSDNPLSTANTSQLAAQSMWHLLQTFLATFPEYNPRTRKSGAGQQLTTGVNLFTESYGGKYGPAIARYFRQQNALRINNTGVANSTLAIDIASLGIINGWLDVLVQAPFYPRFAFNNTYGIRAVSQVQQLNALSAFSGPNGCQAQTVSCRGQAAALDPSGFGTSDSVNSLCSNAAAICQNTVVAPYLSSGRSLYDISQQMLDPFPNSFYLDYLNSIEVQQAVGTSINYTQDSRAVSIAFNRTGDYVRDGVLDDLIETLEAGTRVALIYGDRDYICNWLGGEAISYALAGRAGPAYSRWYSAGYAPIVTNRTYIGGVVREYGNLSFSRIYDAGHLVPAYQPETAFTVFSRIIQGTGISLGNKVDLSDFASSGEANSSRKNTAPATSNPKCFVRAVNATCNTDQKNMLANGAGIVINGVLYNAETNWKAPPAYLASIAGTPGSPPQSTLTQAPTSTTQTIRVSAVSGESDSIATTVGMPTGVYTATGIPSVASTTTSNAAAATRLQKSNIFSKSDTPQALMMAFGLLSFGLA